MRKLSTRGSGRQSSFVEKIQWECAALAAMSLSKKSDFIAKMDRSEEAILVREVITDFVHESDPAELREVAVRALSENGSARASRREYDDAVSAWGKIDAYVRVSDPAKLRAYAAIASICRGLYAAHRGEFRELIEACELSKVYFRRDDPPEFLRAASRALAVGSKILIGRGRYSDAESVLRTTTGMCPDLDELWVTWAEAILLQRDEGRVMEAERYARRAVELGERNPKARQALSDVLARRGRWPESLEQIGHALRSGGDEFREQEKQRVVDSLIKAAAAGQGRSVKRMMAELGLVEAMEPLWHAVRAQLGEELEPLPAEVFDAVMEVRRRISPDDGSVRHKVDPV